MAGVKLNGKRLLIYARTALVLFVIYKWFWGVAPFPYERFLHAILLGYVFVVVVQARFKHHALTSWALVGILILGSIALQTFGLVELLGYGDHGELVTLMLNGEVSRAGLAVPPPCCTATGYGR